MLDLLDRHHTAAYAAALLGDHNDHYLLWLEMQIDTAAIAAEVAYYGKRIS